MWMFFVLFFQMKQPMLIPEKAASMRNVDNEDDTLGWAATKRA